MRRIPSLIIPGLILIGCEALIQIHGWAFWRAHFHVQAGPALSVALGVLAAVWLAWAFAARGWAARLGCGLLGVVATAVLLAGPLYMVSRPLIEARTAADARPAELARLDAAMEARRAELARYLEISASGRYGWHGRIDDARLAIAELEAQRASLANATAAGLPWQTWAACGLQALALLLLQTGAASMAAICGRRWRQTSEPAPRARVACGELEALTPVASPEVVSEPEATSAQAEALETPVSAEVESPESPAPAETDPAESSETPAAPEMNQASETVIQPTEFLIKRLQKRVAACIQASGLSQREWSRREGVNPRDVSLLLNHFNLAKAGKQTVSVPKLNQFAQQFLNQQQAVGA